MLIVVATSIRQIKPLMVDLKERFKIFNPVTNMYKNTMRINFVDATIRFIPKPDHVNKIKGLRPDYFWTDSYEARKYLLHSRAKEFESFNDMEKYLYELATKVYLEKRERYHAARQI